MSRYNGESRQERKVEPFFSVEGKLMVSLNKFETQFCGLKAFCLHHLWLEFYSTPFIVAPSENNDKMNTIPVIVNFYTNLCLLSLACFFFFLRFS